MLDARFSAKENANELSKRGSIPNRVKDIGQPIDSTVEEISKGEISQADVTASEPEIAVAVPRNCVGKSSPIIGIRTASDP